MSIDSGTKEMLASAYAETIDEALSAGMDKAKAHEEAVTAASMLLAAVQGLEDDAARAAVEALGFTPED